MTIFNVIVGNLLVEPWHLFASSPEDYETNEFNYTMKTDSTFIPKIMVEAGIVNSVSEVRRNKPNLCFNLTTPDFIEIKWGKNTLYIAKGTD